MNHVYTAYSVNRGPKIQVSAPTYEAALSMAAKKLHARLDDVVIRYIKSVAVHDDARIKIGK